MAPTPPTQIGGQNQTLLELIYAIKGLAQSVEYMHSDLERSSQELLRLLTEVKRFLEEESRDSNRDIERLIEIVTENQHTVGTLPVAVSDRIEHMVDRISDTMDKRIESVLGDVRSSLGEVRQRLFRFVETRRLIENGEDVPIANNDADVSGKIELTKSGKMSLVFRTEWVQKLATVVKWVVICAATGGGLTGLWKVLEAALRN
jgi:hypothetical protein